MLLLLVLLLARLPVSRRRCDQSLRLSALEVTPVLNATIHFFCKKKTTSKRIVLSFLARAAFFSSFGVVTCLLYTSDAADE